MRSRYKLGLCAILAIIGCSMVWPLISHIMVLNKLNALNLKLKFLKRNQALVLNAQVPNLNAKISDIPVGSLKKKIAMNVAASHWISKFVASCSCPRKFEGSTNTLKFKSLQFRRNFCPKYEAIEANVVMANLYDLLPFENRNGGVWKQGFLIETSDAEWQDKILKVFVVPHSHNDPGWIKTVDQYFKQQTQYILNNVVDYLSEHENRRFVWSEISFLLMWKDAASPEKQLKMKRLIQNGQIEIVTGGWVMNDEANTHYFAMIDQMIEGNEWIHELYGILPKNGWSIDPFGHSPVMAYLLKKLGFENMVIQRTHYSVKKYLSSKQSLEFRWKQQWQKDSDEGILCHMMPFYSYDVPHTCGPDPSVCCQFDFARLKPFHYSCPWGSQPASINNRNIKQRSLALLDQYRKKSKLFRTNVLLVPLGDDFRYTSAAETKAQFENYEKLFDYINNHVDLRAHVQFGTLKEYFDEMRKETSSGKKLPTLTGDFFTYADRDDHYWSGYYVSRPFYKKQGRVLESYLRGAGILYSLALPYIKSELLWKHFGVTYYRLLVKARRNLGLFQHHDAITGTAKPHVVLDYADKLTESIRDTQQVLASSAQLLFVGGVNANYEKAKFDFDEVYFASNQLPGHKALKIPIYLTIYNSLSYVRTDMVTIFVSAWKVSVFNSGKQLVVSQVQPIWNNWTEMKNNQFQLNFVATVPALGFATFTLVEKIPFFLLKLRAVGKRQQLTKQPIEYYNIRQSNIIKEHPFFDVQLKQSYDGVDLKFENKVLRTSFSSRTGFLQSIFHKANALKINITITFENYLTQTGRQKSGAYIFYPDGISEPYHKPDQALPIRVISGVLYSEISVQLPALTHRVLLFSSKAPHFVQKFLQIHNLISMSSKEVDFEISMRIASTIHSAPYFYTDLNGFQMIKRKTYSKLPLQANFYPMPTTAFIQDKVARLTLLTAQPLGVASLRSGELEIMLDRRLKHDDRRGLGQGVLDNVPTLESFTLLLEKWEFKNSVNWDSSLAYPSILAHRLSWGILHPLVTLSVTFNKSDPFVFQNSYSAIEDVKWPCDIHLVNLRSLTDSKSQAASDVTALILHRVGYECGLTSHRPLKDSCYADGYEVPVTSLPNSDVNMTSLALLDNHGEAKFTLAVDVMELEAFKIRFIAEN